MRNCFSSDRAYVPEDYPCLQYGLFFYFCLWLLFFFLNHTEWKFVASPGARSRVEMKLKVILVSFSSIYLWKNIKICWYCSHISPERFWIFSDIALKPTAGSHQIACYHQCSLQNELGLMWPVFLQLVLLSIKNTVNHRDATFFHRISLSWFRFHSL